MWRKELWHPMMVHFPIATLLLASGIGAIMLFKPNEGNGLISARSFMGLLAFGSVTAWLAIYTGLWSYNSEVRRICDPTVMKAHRMWGYYTATFYSVSLVLYAISRWFSRATRLLRYLAISIALGGAGALGYTGHLGASLVYQQGAGVRQPSEDCDAYE